eukprot:scaffold2041_cov37-Cyclotella_meneghiniana.AAC.6
MAKFNLGDTIPEFISLEKRNDADLTVMQLIKRGEATNDILGNPFETIYYKLQVLSMKSKNCFRFHAKFYEKPQIFREENFCVFSKRRRCCKRTAICSIKNRKMNISLKGTIQRYDRMTKYFEGGRFKLNIETWFKSDKSLERHNCIKMTANKYSGSTVTRTSIVIEVGISRELQSEIDTHHGYI